MTTFKFTWQGQPLPQERHRTGKGNTYIPAKTRHYRNELAYAALQQMSEQDVSMFTAGDLALTIVFYRKDNIRVDVDNLLKALKDAWNQIVWGDDSQVVDCHVRLVRGSSEPGIKAFVEPANEIVESWTDELLEIL